MLIPGTPCVVQVMVRRDSSFPAVTVWFEADGCTPDEPKRYGSFHVPDDGIDTEGVQIYMFKKVQASD